MRVNFEEVLDKDDKYSVDTRTKMFNLRKQFCVTFSQGKHGDYFDSYREFYFYLCEFFSISAGLSPFELVDVLITNTSFERSINAEVMLFKCLANKYSEFYYFMEIHQHELHSILEPVNKEGLQ